MSDLWKISAISAFSGYICNLEDNLSSLEASIARLRAVQEGVNGKVQMAHAQQRLCKPEVREWLVGVEGIVNRVTSVLEQGERELDGRCSSCYPRFNCCTSYKLGKEVVELIVQVQTLTNEAKAPEFQDVADRIRTTAVQEIPADPITEVRLDVEPSQGHAPPPQPQDTAQPVAGRGNAPQENTDQSDLAKALHMIGDAGISCIGIYGMGGVGKTFLLNNINNHFVHENSDWWKVIRVVVSRPINLGRIQREIGKSLGFDWKGDNLDEERKNIIFNMLSTMKFLLLLDDCWERVDLQAIGVSSPLQSQKGGKVVFATRSMRVCGLMGAVHGTNTINVKCLNEDKALQLFERVVGNETLNSDSEIHELARDVARECCRLPLTLVTIGKTMSSKRTVPEWRNCLRVLQNSGAGTSDPDITKAMESEIFAKLKFSYDDLHEIHKPCFEYCALYPEDYSIKKDELIRHWIGMGFLEQRSMDEAYDCGYGVIETLKAVNLLESVVGSDTDVKMHDTIRDLAIWFGCECGNRVDKILVQSGNELSEAPLLTPQICSEAERMSLMETSIRSLGDPPATCTNLSTLLLKSNFQLSTISESFFQFMPALKVLNLSWTRIRDLPKSISHLVALEFLDLSGTRIQRVPDELRNLVKLKYLDLSYTYSLTMIPQGVISHLSDLRMLNLYGSGYKNWRVKDPGEVQAAGTADIGVRVSELQELRHLTALGLSVSSTGLLQFLLADKRLRLSITNLEIRASDTSAVSIEVAPSAAVAAGTSSSDLRGMKNLRSLDIEDFGSSSSLKELTVTWTSTGFKCFEALGLWNLEALTTLTIQRQRQSITPTLQFVNILACDALEDLNCFTSLPFLKSIDIRWCARLRRIISNGIVKSNTIIFSGLKDLSLYDLPVLESIYEHALPFPHLETITVCRCPELQRLPLDSNSAKNTLQSIEGEEEWWNNLQWENDEIRTSFQKYYH